MNRPHPLTSMFLSGCSMYNQNRAATSGNASTPTYLSHTQGNRFGFPQPHPVDALTSPITAVYARPVAAGQHEACIECSEPDGPWG
jgi:hypothetical protein